jgi:hypothetical protein
MINPTMTYSRLVEAMTLRAKRTGKDFPSKIRVHPMDANDLLIDYKIHPSFCDLKKSGYSVGVFEIIPDTKVAPGTVEIIEVVHVSDIQRVAPS